MTVDRTTAWARDVVAGRVIAGRLVVLACERHLRDLEEGPARGLWFDVDEAESSINFFPLLRQSKGRWGPRAGKPGARLELAPWQMFTIGCAFGWKRADGTRRFRRVRVEIARKNGKTTLCSGVAIRLTWFDDEAGADVFFAATKKEQAKIGWSETDAMVRAGPAQLSKRVKLYKANWILIDEERAQRCLPLGYDTDGGGSHGLNPHGVIKDEEHAWKPFMRGFDEALETATGARSQPMIWTITTAGLPNSLWAENHDADAAVLEGKVADDSRFAFIASLDPDDDWRDPSVWGKANPSLGVTIQMDYLEEQYRAAQGSPAKERSFMRYHLNVGGQGDDRWIADELWSAQPEAPPLLNMEGRECVAGVYAASSAELAAVCVWFPARGEELSKVDGWAYWQCFVPRDVAEAQTSGQYLAWAARGIEAVQLTPGSATDLGAIRREVLSLQDHFTVTSVGCDSRNTVQLMAELEAEGLTVVKIAPNMTRLNDPTQKVGRMLAEKRLGHEVNPVLSWCIGHAEVLVDGEQRMRLKTDELGADERIDPLGALVCAIHETLGPEEDDGPVYFSLGDD